MVDIAVAILWRAKHCKIKAVPDKGHDSHYHSKSIKVKESWLESLPCDKCSPKTDESVCSDRASCRCGSQAKERNFR